MRKGTNNRADTQTKELPCAAIATASNLSGHINYWDIG